MSKYSSFVRGKPSKVRVRMLAECIAPKYGLTAHELLSICREKHYILARKELAENLARQGFSLTGIGRAMGNDHSTIHNLVFRKRHAKEAAE